MKTVFFLIQQYQYLKYRIVRSRKIYGFTRQASFSLPIGKRRFFLDGKLNYYTHSFEHEIAVTNRFYAIVHLYSEKTEVDVIDGVYSIKINNNKLNSNAEKILQFLT